MVENEGLAEHQHTPKGYRQHPVGIAGQLVDVPQPQVLLVGQVEGEGGETHGVLPLGVHACPRGLVLMQQEQHRFAVAMQERCISHLRAKV